jgi:hypothetical protein
MDEPINLRFKIGAYTPATIPMERLAQYMSDLAAMLGEPSAVHFVELQEGSTSILHRVDPAAADEVRERIEDIREGQAEVVHIEAYKRLNKRLREDETTGSLTDDSTGKVLQFPGRLEPGKELIAPVKQMGTIDGVLIKLGGRDATVPVRVQDGHEIHRCNTTREIARQLGPHIFGPELRFIGVGTWLRSDEGRWTLKVFDIQNFEVLDQTPLRHLVNELRDIGGNWGSDEHVWDSVREIRGESD